MNPKRVATIALITVGVIILVQKVKVLHDFVYAMPRGVAGPPAPVQS